MCVNAFIFCFYIKYIIICFEFIYFYIYIRVEIVIIRGVLISCRVWFINVSWERYQITLFEVLCRFFSEKQSSYQDSSNWSSCSKECRVIIGRRGWHFCKGWICVSGIPWKNWSHESSGSSLSLHFRTS